MQSHVVCYFFFLPHLTVFPFLGVSFSLNTAVSMIFLIFVGPETFPLMFPLKVFSQLEQLLLGCLMSLDIPSEIFLFRDPVMTFTGPPPMRALPQ